jgi:hypothetical protein
MAWFHHHGALKNARASRPISLLLKSDLNGSVFFKSTPSLWLEIAHLGFPHGFEKAHCTTTTPEILDPRNIINPTKHDFYCDNL